MKIDINALSNYLILSLNTFKNCNSNIIKKLTIQFKDITEVLKELKFNKIENENDININSDNDNNYGEDYVFDYEKKTIIQIILKQILENIEKNEENLFTKFDLFFYSYDIAKLRMKQLGNDYDIYESQELRQYGAIVIKGKKNNDKKSDKKCNKTIVIISGPNAVQFQMRTFIVRQYFN